MELKEYLVEIEKFLQDYLEKSHCKSYVLGLSGGVDSSLVAAIARKAVGKDKLYCYAIDIDSNKADIDDAKEVARQLDLNLEVINLSKTYHRYLKDLKGKDFIRLTKSNLKVRMRMVAFFAYAQEHSGLVLGTDNMDERYVGYFTKYGDGAADVLPIVHLTKSEVRQAAEIYGVSKALALRVPSAGLFEGQTDEGEMGVSYADLDAFLMGKEIAPEAKAKIEHMHVISEHKRIDIPTPAPFKR
ncbi:MAG: NAD(+) synthase [Firmicutes bacterium]|nr:NAD(+) synthase [Candidatus Fiminaster equi]